MTRHYELTAEQLATIDDLMPENGKRGGQWNHHRTVLNGILWILHTGAPWRESPERYGKWESVHDRLTRGRANRTIDRILERLHMRLDERGLIGRDLWCADATGIRAGRAAAGAGGKKVAGEPDDHALGRSRGGFGTKLHLVVDGNGRPPSAVVTAGKRTSRSRWSRCRRRSGSSGQAGGR